MSSLKLLVTLLLPLYTANAFTQSSQGATSNTSSLQVDLGYGVYEGFPDQQTGLNAWLGIRYAAAPLGDLRWRAPQPPSSDDAEEVIQANAYGPSCPQAPQSPLPDNYPYQGNEDCLFLSVFAPLNASNLPTVIYIHGGGYGAGNGQENVTQISNMNGNAFVSVVIQYRLEAFGFLASPDVHENGNLNVALLDQHFALEWTQEHVAKFGGDPGRVTLMGQSAGAGSVMMQAMAYGGSEGTQYFEQGIASSPYTPVQYHYSENVPIERYQRFAAEAGCGSASNTLLCLREADTTALQKANAVVGAGVNYGSWAFVPVTDDDFLRFRPSQQLTSGVVNGKRILTSNNADEGAQFVNPNTTTDAAFNFWLRTEYPHLNTSDIHLINTKYYPARNLSTVPFATCGDCPDGPTAVNVGSFAVGPLQRAIDVYSEVTFDCPSLWLAGAYSSSSDNSTSKEGYKYQFSIPPGQHGLDLAAESLAQYPNIFTPNIGPDFNAALTRIWGNFVISGDPSITDALANGNASADPNAQNPASQWPLFRTASDLAASDSGDYYQMLNLNQSGGTPWVLSPITGLGPTTYLVGDVRNNFSQVNAYSWEGGRGERCEFWKQIGERVPV